MKRVETPNFWAFARINLRRLKILDDQFVKTPYGPIHKPCAPVCIVFK